MVSRYDIFVCYSRVTDDRVRSLVDLLRASGYRVFYDQTEIRVGDKWKERLDHAVASSRVLVLCWSREADASGYVHFELSRAEGLNKPVLPWLMDSTELPKLMEIQGITQQDPAEVFARLKPRLGLKLRWLRLIQTVVLMLVFAAAFAGYRYTHRPWVFTGVVRSTADESPLSGVTVEVTTPDDRRLEAFTQSDGHYSISIPLRKPASVDVLFRKSGFYSDHETAVTTAQDYIMYLSPSQ